MGLLEKLEPWNLGKMEAFQPGMLTGIQAQRYQIDLPAGFAAAQTKMAHKIDRAIRKDIGGNKQRIYSKNTSYLNVTFKHVLLPIYIAAYRYNNKTYQLLVNAATGEVQGQRPWSVWKITVAAIAAAIVIGVIAWLFVTYG